MSEKVPNQEATIAKHDSKFVAMINSNSVKMGANSEENHWLKLTEVD